MYSRYQCPQSLVPILIFQSQLWKPTHSIQQVINSVVLPVPLWPHPVDLTAQPTVSPSFVGHRQSQSNLRKQPCGNWLVKSFSVSFLFSFFLLHINPGFFGYVWEEKIKEQCLLRWSCSAPGSRSDCGCTGQLAAVSLWVRAGRSSKTELNPEQQQQKNNLK